MKIFRIRIAMISILAVMVSLGGYFIARAQTGTQGACVLRSTSVSIPGYYAPNTGTGYAKTSVAGTTLDGVRANCPQSVFDSLQSVFCSMNSGTAEQLAVLYDAGGNWQGNNNAPSTSYTTLTCSGGGGGGGGGTPSAPMNFMLNGTPTSAAVPLRWDASSGADNYNLERKFNSVSGPWSSIASIAMTTYTDASAGPGSSYDYRVQACHAGYGCSNYTVLTGIYVPPSGGSTPPAPTTVNASANGTTANVSWGASSGATIYYISRETTGNPGTRTEVNSTTGLTSYDTVPAGGTYTYFVRACNGSLCSYDTSSNPVTLGSAPSAPSLTAPASSGIPVSLSWSSVSGATRYQLFRRTPPGTGGFGSSLTGSAYTGTTWADSTVTPGVTYEYVASAGNDAGWSGYSTYASVAVSSGGGGGGSSSPIGYWRFDGNGMNDISGGQNAQNMGAATYVTSGGRAGGYAYIPGGSDYFRIPYASMYDLPDTFTVEFWFRQRADRSFLQNLVYKGSPSNNYNFYIYRQLWNANNYGPIITGYTAQSTGAWTQTSNPNQMAHNVWHHVVFTKNSSQRVYYLDGVLIHSASDSPIARTPAVDIIIGNSAVDTDIDELKIYNRALSASEVSQGYGVYATPTPTPTPNATPTPTPTPFTTPTPTPTPTPAPPACVTCPPANPTNLQASFIQNGAGGPSVNLLWTDNAMNESEFKIFRRMQYGSSWSFERSYGSNITSVQIAAPASTGGYEYYVAACNGYGCSGMSNFVVVTMGMTATPTPTPPPSNNPQVQSWTLSIGSGNVSILGIGFSKDMNPASFTDDLVYLYRANDSARTHIPVTIQKTTNSVNLWTIIPLSAGVEYVSVVATSVQSAAGYSLAASHSCRFAGLMSGTYPACPGGTMTSPTPSPMPSPSTTPIPSPSPYPSPSPSPMPDTTPYAYVKTIRGSVRTASGSPVTDAEIGAWKADSGTAVMAWTDVSGNFTLKVFGGSWQVGVRPKTDMTAAASWAYPHEPIYISFAFDNVAEERPAHFVVNSMMSRIIGRVQDSYGGVPGKLWAHAGSGMGYGPGVPVSADGSFTILLTPGAYTLQISQEGRGPLSESFPVSLGENDTKDVGLITLRTYNERIEGTVRNSSGAVLPNVPVNAFVAASQQYVKTVTGPDGRYSMYVNAGEWRVSAEPFADSNYANPEPPRVVTVTSGAIARADFTLIFADGTISGAVTDESGAVIETLFGYVKAGGFSSADNFGGALEHGRYSFRVKSGSYKIFLGLPPDADFATPAPQDIVVKAGAKLTLSWKLTRNVSLITGHVKNASGVVLTNLSLRISAIGSNALLGGTAAVWQGGFYNPATGSFRIPVGEGTWFISVEVLAGGNFNPPRPDTLKVYVAPGASEVRDIVLESEQGIIKGTVYAPDGKPFPNVLVSVTAPGTAATDAGYMRLYDVETDANGFYKINVPAASYDVRAFSPPSKTMQNPESVRVSISAGETRAVDLRFRTSSAVIAGKVEGVSGKSFVYAWSEKGGYVETETADDGSYTLNVTKGEKWNLAASGESNKTLFKSADVSVSVGNEARVERSIQTVATHRLPDPVTAVGNCSEAKVVGVQSGAAINIPPNAFQKCGKVTVTITPDTHAASQMQERVVGVGYAIEVRGEDAKTITSLSSDAIITFPYTDADVAALGANPKMLTLSFWDESVGAWRQVANAAVDSSRHVVSGSVNHLSRFALIAPADTQPPDPPYGVKVAAVAGGIKVSWSNPTYDFHHARVYRSGVKDVIGAVVNDYATEASYLDTPDGDAYYTVRAVDLAGNESNNTTQYTTAGPVTPPSPKELGPQTIPSFSQTSDDTPVAAASAPNNPQIPSYQKYANGTLIAAEGDSNKVWIIMNGFKRYVVSQKVLGFYPHLKNAPVVTVPKEEFDRYGRAAWVRYVNSPKVYEVNDDATKHWLDMSAEDFYNTGRRWEAVFVINKQEVDFYKTGVNVTVIK